MGKRGHNEGTIYRHRATGLWAAQVTVGYDAAGRPKRRTVYGKTRQEVAEKMARLLVETRQGILADPTRETVREFLERWLRDVVQPSVRPNTYLAYRNVVHRHIIPEIGALRLQKLAPAHVQAMLARRREAGLSPRMVQMCYETLRTALNRAVKWGLLPRNPCDAVERPKGDRRAMRPLTDEQARRLLAVARQDRLHALFLLALTTGLRLGELLGLTWNDVDLRTGRLRVRHQLQYTGGKPTLVPPKSARGRRSVVLPPPAVEALRQHRRRQAEERLRAGEAWQDWGLVFCTEIGTPLHPSNVRNRVFRRLLEEAGLPRVRFHDLRHTCATLALQAGVHPKVVQEMLGHATIAVTLDTYSHVLPSLQEEAAARLHRILFQPALQ